MNRKKRHHDQARICLKKISVAVALAAGAMAAQASDDNLKIDGSLRQELSWNMADWKDTPRDDKGKLSMMRTTARMNVDWKATNSISVVGKFRVVGEPQTEFLRDLEKMGANNARLGPANGAVGDIMSLYNRNGIGDVVRELYIDMPLSDRVRMRLGKQQIAWGETDFFAANDLVHGFDYTWRSFLEPNNEYIRKPNIMAKFNIDVPEADGAIELFVRPGWDRKRDIGTELDLYGSRWSTQSTAGVDFRNITPYDLENREGDYKKVTGGIRWSGMAKDINYSVSYLKTFYPSPVMNAASTLKLFNAPAVPSGAQTLGRNNTLGLAGDVIYPIVDLIGFTASGYSNSLDAVFSTELAYIMDAPYQLAALPGGGVSPLSAFVAPGFNGLEQKDVMAMMVRMDKNLAFTQSLLGTEKPMFFSVQLFDKWIQDFKRNELLNAVGAGQKTKEHSVLLTTIMGLSYANGRVLPELVLGFDMSYGGGFAVPSVTFELSKNLRWKVEYDKFWDNGHRDQGRCSTPGTQSTCDSASIFGYFHNRDQLYTSMTYLF